MYGTEIGQKLWTLYFNVDIAFAQTLSDNKKLLQVCKIRSEVELIGCPSVFSACTQCLKHNLYRMHHAYDNEEKKRKTSILHGFDINKVKMKLQNNNQINYY